MFKTEVFKSIKKGNVTYLQIPDFEASGLVNHCFSTRLGGVSSGIYESMNLGFGRGDSEDNVRKNFRHLCKAVGILPEHMIFTDQIHEDIIKVVTKADCGKGFDRQSDLLGVDGLITNERQVALVTFYADCVPLYFLDPINHAIGLSHAGWRGTVKKIGAKTIQRMKSEFNSKPQDILAAIGPSIGPCCFEVSEDVKIEVEKILNHDIIEKIVKNHREGKYMLDLWSVNETILLEAGIKKENITKSDLCTMCNKEVLFSHRGTNGQRGSLAAMIELK